MKQTQICFVSGTSLVLFLFLISPAWGQINVGRLYHQWRRRDRRSAAGF